jgi:branched-chain amino acid transport system substrate-binding protein
MAVDERNKRGGVLGRQVQLAVEDNANNPGIGVEKARKLIQVDKVVALMGSVNSGVSIATSGVAFENKIPYIDTGGHADAVTGTGCHWTTFRTCHSTWMETHATGFSIQKKLGKKWYFITPDYAFGHALLTGYQDVQAKLGIQIVGTDLTPLGTTDFSAYLTKVQDAKPDVLILMVQGDDLVNCLKQANSSGLLKRLPVAGPQGELEIFWALPKEARVGYWGFEWYYNSPLVLGKNSRATGFIRDYIAQNKQPPTARSVFGYITAGRIMDAIDAAKGTDAVKICKAIENQKFDVLSNTDGYYRDVDHQLIWPMWFGQIRAAGTPKDEYDIFEVLDEQPGEKVERTADEQRGICKMAYP